MTRLTLILSLCLATPAMAGETAQTMADGAPWDMQDSSGRSAQLRLNPDGTARVRLGMMGSAANWVPTPDGLCLTTRALGEVCLVLQPTDRGYAGTATDGRVFVFTR